MSVRKQLADLLVPVLPKAWRVLPYLDNIDATKVPVVMIGQASLARNAKVPLSYRDHSLTIRLLVPETDPSKADDILEANLDLLLAEVEALTKKGVVISWTGADRDIISNLPAYDITAVLTHAKTTSTQGD